MSDTDISRDLQRRINKALALHTSSQYVGDCLNCEGQDWPCPTVRALTEVDA